MDHSDTVLRPAPTPRSPAPPAAVDLALHALAAHRGRGLLLGMAPADRSATVRALLAPAAAPAVVLVPTEAGVTGWREALGPPGLGAGVTITTWNAFAEIVHRREEPMAVLVADGCDRVPVTALQACLQPCPAPIRIGFTGERPTWERVQHLGRLLGPTVWAQATAVHTEGVLHLPLTDDEREDYDTAWSTFLGAYDRFQAMAPGARFPQFVRWARQDPAGRPGLLAWHRALRALHCTTGKRTAVRALLERHRGRRILLFTADRDSAYALAQDCLVMPLTGEMARSERLAALQAHARGELPVLVGPRLLEEAHGLPPADLGVVVGRAFGESQHQARRLRVAPQGAFLELVAAETIESARLAPLARAARA